MLADYSVDALTLRYSVQRADPASASWWSLRVSGSVGHVDLDHSPNQAADELTARVAGRYALLRATAQAAIPVGSISTWSTRLGGQTASKNLDISERFAIGGASAVRAYPAGEGYGTNGALFSTEWQTALSRWLPGITTAAFVDVGSVGQLKNTAFVGAPERNRITLSGGGLWGEWRPRAMPLVTRLTIAAPFGHHHPINGGSDQNQDGSRFGPQWWLSAQWTF